MDVLGLLRSKNNCLRKFLETSTEYLAQAQRTGELPELASFEERREAILRAISLFDRKISEAVALLPPGKRPQSLIDAVKESLDEKEKIVHRILLIDDQILQLVEIAKARTLKEIAVTSKQAATVQKFKSTWIPESGEEIDKKL